MPAFTYTARDATGSLVQSHGEAVSKQALAGELRRSGLTPIKIDRAQIRPTEVRLPAFLNRDRIDLDELIFLCRQLERLVRAGVPLIGAIQGLASATSNPGLSRVLREVNESLRSGRDLASSLARHPQFFSSLFVSVVAVGENTGRLDQCFADLRANLELERETRRRIKTATRYPLMVAGALVLAFVIINVFVIPTFARMFESFGAELPWATRVLMTTSRLTLRFWPVGLGLCVTGVVVFRRWVATDAGRLAYDRLKLRVPVVGSILERAMLARYARSFAMTLGAGLDVIESLRTSARASDNRFVERRLGDMIELIQKGESFTRAATTVGIFDPVILQMLSVGETTGALGESHQDVAEAYESEVDYDLRRLTDLIEPMLIVGAGVIVFILALGVYLPMWELSTAIKGGR